MFPQKKMTTTISGSLFPHAAAKAFVYFALLAAILASMQPSRLNVHALDNGLARRPPMGWLAWERFTCQTDCVQNPTECINENLFMSMADRLVSDGYAQFGYKYVNIDDCWSELEREPNTGRLVANQTRFPGGIQQVAQYVRDKGLKLGLYGDCGLKTCAGYPAQLKSVDTTDNNGHTSTYFHLDSQTLTDWQVESFKFDGCFIDPLKAERICPRMADALHEAANTGAGRQPILLVCEWPFYMMYAHAKPNFTLAQESCNVWRYYDDIEDSWSSILNTIDYSVKHQSTIARYHGPGHWFDPDQLVIGNFGLSFEQARAQMAIWALWSAPLYMSNDLRAIDPKFASILKNKHIIGVNQDRLGVWGLMVNQSEDGNLQAFVKPIEPINKHGCPSFMVVYLNRRVLGNKIKMSFELRDLLLGAPIYQAAKNQRLVEAFESQNQASSSSSPSMEPIEASSCLKRLAEGTRDVGATTGGAGRNEVIEFKLNDLLDDNYNMAKVRLDGQLELDVGPSSVRAVRLVETN